MTAGRRRSALILLGGIPRAVGDDFPEDLAELNAKANRADDDAGDARIP